LTIKRLLYEERLTIEGAKRYLSKRKGLMKEIKAELMEILEILKNHDIVKVL
jgi:hypothetical protein